MVEKVRISVAMASYNGVRYIGEQLESILKQLGECDEIIISDDGSSDGTVELIEKYQKQDERIHFVKGPGKGIKKNVENAIKNARGSYIFLADQDDIWLEQKTEHVMRAFEQNGCSLVIHDAKVFQDENTGNIIMDSFFKFRNSGSGAMKNIIKNSYIGCCMAFKSELKEVILPIPKSIEMHDQWIGVLNDYKNNNSCFLKEPLILYRRHGENNSAMTHYGIGKMLRNRIVFCICFLMRILKIS